jgi:hypothetical protein
MTAVIVAPGGGYQTLSMNKELKKGQTFIAFSAAMLCLVSSIVCSTK